MTEPHTPEFEAFCDEHGFDYNSAYPEDQQEVKAAWTAWQATRAMPMDQENTRLDKPAQVGNGRFGVGVKWSTVIGAAQRHHDYMNTPEKERDRIAMGKEFIERFATPADHSASLTSDAPVDRSLLAWAKQLPLRSVSASSIAEIKFLLDHFEATRNAAPQPPKNAADHIVDANKKVSAVSVSDLFYLQDSRSYVGNDVLWWANLGEGGYTTDLRKARVFTKEDAQAHHNSRESDIPWPKEYIDAKTRPAVDMQYIKKSEALAGTGIVLRKPQKPKHYNFNCVGCGRFLNDVERYSYDCPNCGADNRP